MCDPLSPARYTLHAMAAGALAPPPTPRRLTRAEYDRRSCSARTATTASIPCTRGQALDAQEPPVLVNDPVHHREPEARPPGFVVKNGSNARARVAASMPTPVSVTRTSA